MNGAISKIGTSGCAFWLLGALVGFYLIYPLRESLRFGIDLVGGSYITLDVQTDKAIEEELFSLSDSLVDRLKKAKNKTPEYKKLVDKTIVLGFASPTDTIAAASFLKVGSGKELVISTKDKEVSIGFTERKMKHIGNEALSRNIEVLRKRLDKLSVAEITITAKGERQIVVELPDVDDPEQAKKMIGTPAILEFKLVEKSAVNHELLLEDYDGQLPDDMEILPGSDQVGVRYYLVSKKTDVSGRYLKDAKPDFDSREARMVVSFVLSAEGGERFYQLTSQNFGKLLAIVLDGVVITAAHIKDAISSTGMISGHFSADEARELAVLLKSGSFVAPVTFAEERQIGPTLGQKSIRQGILSCIIGLSCLFVFSLFYYGLAGLLAFIALLYNVILIIIGLAWLKATLTLPGIAGMVLTVGMAIDASILIFERIREELEKAAPLAKAVEIGFSDALRVILDANITTFIVGVVLYRFGTGPVQGFAVTMMLGIISTLITGIFFLKSLFTVILENSKIKRIGI
ncbi:MAG: protein translocase subunit SecD [Candidatus Babeliales bacterium]